MKPKGALDSEHVFGWWSADDEQAFTAELRQKEPFREMVWANKMASAAGYLLSAIGAIRICVAGRMLYLLYQEHSEQTSMRRHLWTQVGRGLMELFHLGPILAIIDLVSAIINQSTCRVAKQV